MPVQNPRIFVSYSRSDGKIAATKLRQRLIDEHGFGVWQDVSDLEGGKDWWAQIETVIRHPDLEYLVLVITENSVRSEVVRDEWRLALQEGKCVLPVIGAQGVKEQIASLPGWMKAAHFIDPDEHEQWQRFIRTLESPCEQVRVPMMAPRPPIDFIRRPEQFETLQCLLISETPELSGSTTVALRGAGGYGKTTLAKACAMMTRYNSAFMTASCG